MPTIFIFLIYAKMQPTLVILAAGMGSRFGGNKQIEQIGPSGECIMDYSVYDAIKAGFAKVVFVIKENFKESFISSFNTSRFNNLIQVEYVYQDVNKLPAEFSLPEFRTKPWGTNHALMMALDIVKEPFASINADDFYGRQAFMGVAEFLKSNYTNENHYCVMGYDISKTLVESGGTSRAECIIDKDNYLTFVEERTEVKASNGIIKGLDIHKEIVEINKNAIVSMNFWGFTPDYFKHSNFYFKEFLTKNINNPSAEFLIPAVVNDLIKKNKLKVKVLNSHSEWFGITFKEDKFFVAEKLINLVNKGIYPAKLW